MSVEEVLRKAQALPDYWCGYLSSAIEHAIDDLASDPYRPEALEGDVRPIRMELERALRAYRESPVPQVVGYLVEAADGEPLSLCLTIGEAEKARRQAAVYFDGAATCGHPDGPGYARAKLPATVRHVTRAEWDEIVENGTPLLDREG